MNNSKCPKRARTKSNPGQRKKRKPPAAAWDGAEEHTAPATPPLLGQPHPYLPGYHVVEPIPYLSRATPGHPTIWLRFVGDRSNHTILLDLPDKPFEVSTPRWEEWLRKPSWHVWEAARLMFGLDTLGLTEPDGVPRRRGAPDSFEGPMWPPEAVVLELLARAAIDAGELRSVKGGVFSEWGWGAESIPSHVERDRRKGEKWSHERLVRPSDFLRWAADKGYTIPVELRPLLEQVAPEETTGAGAGKLVLFREGHWPGTEEQLDKVLTAFSTDNRNRPGFALSTNELVEGAARRRWHVYWTPHGTSKVLPNGELDPDGDNPHAVIRFLDVPEGPNVDIRARDWRREELHAYLNRLVDNLKSMGLTVIRSRFFSQHSQEPDWDRFLALSKCTVQQAVDVFTWDRPYLAELLRNAILKANAGGELHFDKHGRVEIEEMLSWAELEPGIRPLPSGLLKARASRAGKDKPALGARKLGVGQGGDGERAAPPDCAHSPDFRSVFWFGQEYSFTVNQAQAVEQLWQAWSGRTPDLAGETVLTACETAAKTLKAVFEKGTHPAWGTMIVPGRTKGAYRLNPPENSKPPR